MDKRDAGYKHRTPANWKRDHNIDRRHPDVEKPMFAHFVGFGRISGASGATILDIVRLLSLLPLLSGVAGLGIFLRACFSRIRLCLFRDIYTREALKF